MLPLVDVLHFSRVQILEWYSVIHGKASKSCAFIKLDDVAEILFADNWRLEGLVRSLPDKAPPVRVTRQHSNMTRA